MISSATLCKRALAHFSKTSSCTRSTVSCRVLSLSTLKFQFKFQFNLDSLAFATQPFMILALTNRGWGGGRGERAGQDFRTGPYFIMHAEAVLSGVMHVQIFLVFEERNSIVTECIMK